MDFILGLILGVASGLTVAGIVFLKLKKSLSVLGRMIKEKDKEILNEENITLGDLITNPENVPIKILASIPRTKFNQLMDYLKEVHRTTMPKKSSSKFDLITLWDQVPAFLKPMINSWVKSKVGYSVDELLQNPLAIDQILSSLQNLKPVEKPAKEVKEGEIPTNPDEFEKYMKEKYGLNVAVR